MVQNEKTAAAGTILPQKLFILPTVKYFFRIEDNTDFPFFRHDFYELHTAAAGKKAFGIRKNPILPFLPKFMKTWTNVFLLFFHSGYSIIKLYN